MNFRESLTTKIISFFFPEKFQKIANHVLHTFLGVFLVSVLFWHYYAFQYCKFFSSCFLCSTYFSINLWVLCIWCRFLFPIFGVYIKIFRSLPTGSLSFNPTLLVSCLCPQVCCNCSDLIFGLNSHSGWVRIFSPHDLSFQPLYNPPS